MNDTVDTVDTVDTIDSITSITFVYDVYDVYEWHKSRVDIGNQLYALRLEDLSTESTGVLHARARYLARAPVIFRVVVVHGCAVSRRESVDREYLYALLLHDAMPVW